MTPTSIPQTPPDYEQARVIERPDGFYWQDKLTGELHGSFSTLIEVMQSIQNHADTGYEEGESLQEAEAEIGIADWTDPETGQPAESLQPHLSDE